MNRRNNEKNNNDKSILNKCSSKQKIHTYQSFSRNKQSDSQRSVKRSTSIKYLRQISPRRNVNNLNSSNKTKILSFLENTGELGNDTYSSKKKYLKNRNYISVNESQKQNEYHEYHPYQKQSQCQPYRKKNIFNHTSCHQQILNPNTKKQTLLQTFKQNQEKIILMRQNLEEIFSNYKTRQKQMKEMKAVLGRKQSFRKENSLYEEQIGKIKEMIKEALLEREKIKFNPFKELTKRKT